MNVLLLTVIVLAGTGQSILKKIFGNKHTGGSYFFAAATAFAAMLFFLVGSLLDGKAGILDPACLPYSFGFAIAYAICNVSFVLAVTHGPLALTALLCSYSLIVPTLYGLIFLSEPITVFLVLGLLLLCISLFFVRKKETGKRASPIWALCVILSVLSNGMCSVVQKMQQLAFGGAYKNEFMIVALFFVLLFLLPFVLVKERRALPAMCKHGLCLGGLCGALNGVVNLLVMILSGSMAASVMFPIISAGGIALTFLVAKFLYKEKHTRMQYLGFGLGMAAIVFLNF